MRVFILLLSGILLLAGLTLCKGKEAEHHLYYEADSLIQLTLDLQAKIGSPEIRRMHEFQEEINQDLAVLSPLTEEDTAILRYIELFDGLSNCMQACNQYHEEAYMLEIALRDLMEELTGEDADYEKIRSVLHSELNNYQDLSRRVDSGMSVAISKAEEFYSLKPEINLLREELKSVPDPQP